MRFFFAVISILLFGLFFGEQLYAQTDFSPRIKKNLNDGWEFTFEEPDSASWKKISLSGPIFQTQRVNPEYRFDIPKGTNEVSMLIADVRSELSIFDIRINDKTVLKEFSLERSDEKVRAIEKSIVVENSRDSIFISFNTSKGRAAINGIGIRKLTS